MKQKNAEQLLHVLGQSLGYSLSSTDVPPAAKQPPEARGKKATEKGELNSGLLIGHSESSTGVLRLGTIIRALA